MTYVALSTGLGGCWQPLATGSSKREARAYAEQAILHDRYHETLMRNLVVLTESAARHGHYMQCDQYVATCNVHGPYLTGGRADDQFHRCPGYSGADLDGACGDADINESLEYAALAPRGDFLHTPDRAEE